MVNEISETKEVKCIECHGIMRPSVMSLQFEREDIVLIFEDVPCLECPSCGQQEILGAIAEEISNLAEDFVKTNQTVRHKFRELLDSLVALGKISNDSNEWISRFDKVIEGWKSSYKIQ